MTLLCCHHEMMQIVKKKQIVLQKRQSFLHILSSVPMKHGLTELAIVIVIEL
jgi:hypothetical protein